METAIELECLDGTKLAVDLNEIFMYKEENPTTIEDNNGNEIYLPKHTVVSFRQCALRVKDTYDEIKEKIRLSKILY